jgi:hypothetical protein
MHAIALLLRYKLHHESGQRVPGSFELPITKSLNETRIALYEFLLSVPLDDEMDRVTLGIQVHALSVSLLTAKCRASNRFGHIFDITIPIALYKGNGIYTNANTATRYCAWLQFCLRSVAIQATRLGGVQKLYIPFQRMINNMEDSKVVELNDDGWGQGDDEGLEELDVVGDVMLQTGEARGQKVPEPIFLVDGLDKTDETPSSNISSRGPLSIMEGLGSHPLEEDVLLV